MMVIVDKGLDCGGMVMVIGDYGVGCGGDDDGDR